MIVAIALAKNLMVLITNKSMLMITMNTAVNAFNPDTTL